jgi:two-component system, cell cycle sensor histidine kinase and response regulator CckA
MGPFMIVDYQALREAEEKFRSIFENAAEGIFQSTPSGNIIDANPALARMLGYESPAELMATITDIRAQLHVDPERRSEFARMLEEQAVVQRFEAQVYRKDGGKIWISVNARAVRGNNGNTLYYEGTAEDITELKRMEALSGGQSKILEMIARNAPLENVLANLVRLIEAQSDGMLCSILLLDEDGQHLRHGAAPSLPETYTKAIDGASIGPRAGSCGTAAYRGQPVIVTDIMQDPLWADWRDLAKAHGLRACWSTPIRSHHGKVLGTFAMYYGDVRSPNPAETHLIGIATHLAGIAIERKRAEEALREGQELYRLITDSSNDLIALMDFQGRTVFVSPSVRQMTGWEPAQILGAESFDFIHPEDLASSAERFAAALAGETVTFVHRGRHADGTWRWLEGWGQMVQFRGKPHILAVSRDITERKRTEDALRESIGARRLVEQQLRLQASALESAANSIIVTGRDGAIQWVNPAFTRATGYTLEEALGNTPRILKSGKHDASFYEKLWKTILSGEVWQGETTNRRKDGSLYVEETTITPVRSADGEISNFIAIKVDVTERKRAEFALREAEEQYRTIFEENSIGICNSAADGRYLSVNPAFARIFGYDSPEEMLFRVPNAKSVYVDPNRRREIGRELREQGKSENSEIQVYRKDGSKIWLRASVRAARNADGGLLYYVGSAEDITEQRRLEEQFRQAQKMEAVGLLAGGIAHDFNNLLGVILGNADLLLEATPSNAQQHYAEEIKKAGGRAAQLTRQLLTFSRKQVLYPTILDLNAIVHDFGKILQRLIGEDVQIVTDLGKELGSVRADRGQMEQILMNLATNARDAMPNGGKFTIRTENAELGAADVARYPYVRPGRYIRVSMSDTGMGMSAAVQARVFEPFFTTKQQGRGTGLGLATVYGIVKQSAGYIWIASEPGAGASFDIYLPRLNEKALPLVPDLEVRTESPRGTETIFLLEDEDSLRKVTCEFLTASGYRVLQAGRGDQAIGIAEQYKPSIHLIVSDVVLPDMSGPSIVARMQALHPEAKVLYVSGYAEVPVAQQLIDQGAILMQKPVWRKDLLRKIHEMLHVPR